MKRLELDFNSRDERDRLRIGPEAEARNAGLRRGHLVPDSRVIVVDGEGNTCIGTLRRDHLQPAGHQWFVEMDWATWTDAIATPDAEQAPSHTAVATP